MSTIAHTQVFFAKEPYKRDDILQKRPIILSILLIVATPYRTHAHEGACDVCVHICRIIPLEIIWRKRRAGHPRGIRDLA